MRMIQGSICDDQGCPYDYEWALYQRRLDENGVAEIPRLRPVAEEKEDQE